MYIEAKILIFASTMNSELAHCPIFVVFSEPEIFRRQSLRSDQSVQHLWGHHEKAPQFQGQKKTINPTNHISSKYSIYKDGDLASRYPTGLRRLGQVQYILSLSHNIIIYTYIYIYIHIYTYRYIIEPYIYITPYIYSQPYINLVLPIYPSWRCSEGRGEAFVPGNPESCELRLFFFALV